MVDTSVADLRNSNASTDETNYAFKQFSNSLEFRELQHSRTNYNITGYARTSSDPNKASVTNGTDLTIGDLSLLQNEYIIDNSNNKALLLLTSNELFDTLNDWNFNYDTGIITIGTNSLVSKNLVNENKDFTKATITIYNINTDINNVCKYYIITDTQEIEIQNNNTYTFSITDTLKIKIKRSEDTTRNVFDDSLSFPIIFDKDDIVATDTNMFTQIGKPMMFIINYN